MIWRTRSTSSSRKWRASTWPCPSPASEKLQKSCPVQRMRWCKLIRYKTAQLIWACCERVIARDIIENQTIWQPDTFRPFRYQTFPVFRWLLYFISNACLMSVVQFKFFILHFQMNEIRFNRFGLHLIPVCQKYAEKRMQYLVTFILILSKRPFTNYRTWRGEFTPGHKVFLRGESEVFLLLIPLRAKQVGELIEIRHKKISPTRILSTMISVIFFRSSWFGHLNQPLFS